MTMDEQGLYALYRKDKLHYVGLASNLRNRIPHHLKDRLKGTWTHFSLYIIRHPDHIKELESLLLRIAYPKGNSIKGKLKRSANFLPILKRNTKQAAIEEWENIFRNSQQSANNHKVSHKRKRKYDSKAERPLQGLLKAYQRIYCTYNGKEHKAKVLPNGVVELIPSKKRFDSPSMAGIAVIKKKTINGWKLWKYKDKNGELVYIDTLRN